MKITTFTFLLAHLFLIPAHAAEQPRLNLLRHAPCNLFDVKEDVAFTAKLQGVTGSGDATAVLRDETGKELLKKNLKYDAKAGTPAEMKVDLGKPGRGYFTLEVQANVAEGLPVSSTCAFGVMDFVNRTAKEARDGGYVFGLKWWSGIQKQKEVEEAMVKLGLQWTRIIQNEGGAGNPERLTIGQILGDYPMNAVIKVERFPKELYDEQRYGPLEEWEKKYGKGAWVIKTVPKKEPYKQWLRTQLAAIPPEQEVFEIWNEPWDKMSPEDFATVCQWIAEVILESRPDAIIGPNFYGSTSPYEYDAKVIAAGGMKGMKMVALHPYAGSEDREWLRGYRQWLKQQLGREFEIYITEYGSHSTPEGPARRSEMEQARRVVRQSLALYAEGSKALIPHWAGQSEKNSTYIEDWFGFVRKNEEPKPVLIAHANCARMVDGGRYLGDLWYGPGVAALLFEKNGVHTLALWTIDKDRADGENTSRKEIEIEGAAGKIVDILGREQPIKEGKLKLTLDESPIYLVGVGEEFTKLASRELRPDRWPKPEKVARTKRETRKLQAEPILDGKFTDWKGAAELALVNPKVNGYDCSGMGYVAWNDQYLFIGVDMRDNEMMNKESRAKLYRHDSVELFISTEPREEGSGYGPKDRQFFITPTSADGSPFFGEVTDREAGAVTNVEGAKLFAGPMRNPDPGWAVEVAIPWRALKDFRPEQGGRLAVDMRVNDADTSHERFKIDPTDVAANFQVTNPSTWSLLILAD